jgi:hypothetical protein
MIKAGQKCYLCGNTDFWIYERTNKSHKMFDDYWTSVSANRLIE